MSVTLLLATAIALGMRHALDPDHLVAVSTMVAEERRLWPAARLGLIWGFGHLVPIALVGLPVLLLRLELPTAMENVVDLGVGLLLVVLGVRTIWRLRKERVHLHPHTHGGSAHAHFHAHGQAAKAPAASAHQHAHGHVARDGRRGGSGRGWITFAIGMVHGLAGSGAAAVLALTAAPTVTSGVGYLLAFGIGTCAGMFAATFGIAVPALSAVAYFGRLQSTVRMVAGLASMAVGALMWVQLLPTLLG